MKRVTVLLNREKDEHDRLAIFSRLRSESAYREGDELEAVYTYYLDDDDGILDRVFSDFNRGSPTFVGDEEYPQRSLSVGDVVEVESFRWICAPSGWQLEDFEERERRIMEHAESHPLVNKGCDCKVDTGFRCYPEDGTCPCGCVKHHVHNNCGHIVQWG